MRNVVLAVALVILAALATVVTLAYEPVAKTLARSDGYSAPAVPADQPDAHTATATGTIEHH